MFMNAVILESPERKLVMWYKCNEKKALGLTKAQIARELGLDVKTVRKYLRMSDSEPFDGTRATGGATDENTNERAPNQKTSGRNGL